jgi:hypothetical protein
MRIGGSGMAGIWAWDGRARPTRNTTADKAVRNDVDGIGVVFMGELGMAEVEAARIV